MYYEESIGSIATNSRRNNISIDKLCLQVFFQCNRAGSQKRETKLFHCTNEVQTKEQQKRMGQTNKKGSVGAKCKGVV